MALSREDVKHIAELARLELNAAELALYQEQLSAILEYAARLQTLDTTAISPTATALALHSVLRNDEPGATLPQAEALFNAPAAADGCFLVPPVLAAE